MGSKLKITAIAAVAFLFSAGLCHALCFVADPALEAFQTAAEKSDDAHPCHSSTEAPSSDDAERDCDSDCSRFEGAAIATAGARALVDAPSAPLAIAPLDRTFAPEAVRELQRASTLPPPPRDLVLLKSSFLI